jgi:hypothetical protein
MTTEARAVTSTHRGWEWAFLAVFGGAVLLVVAGVILAVVIAHNEGVTSFPRNSPEGTVQRYLRLLQCGNTDRAYTMTEIADFGPGAMSRAQFDQQFASWSQTSHQVSLQMTTLQKGSASVAVEISSFSGSPFGASSNSTRVIFTLIRSGRGWLITGPPYLP